jgi:hypothetical protein
VFRLASAFVCLLLAAAAQAQLTTSRVNVYITGARCVELRNVFLVIDDDDLESRWILLKALGDCHWTADLGESGSVSTALSHFSLRAGIARTDCHEAAPNEEKLAAELEFTCCRQGPLRDVHVTTEPPMPVSYLRKVLRDPTAPRRIRPIDCVEVGTFLTGTGAIRQGQFSGEAIYLQLGELKPKRRMLGLPLNDIVVDDGVLVLTRDGLTYRLIVLRARGKVRSAPTFSSNAISIDIKRLDELKFEHADFEVIK